MKIIDRYIGKQVLFATSFAVIVLSFVLVLGNIFKELLDQLVQRPDLDFGYVVRFVGNVLPFSLIFTIPWGFLTSVLLVFGRLSADNELVSFRMAGLSMARISASVFGLSIALCMFSYWLNVSVAPKAQANVKNMIVEMVTDDPLTFFSAGEVVDIFPGYIIHVKDKVMIEETGEYELRGMELVEIGDNGRAVRYINAERVTLQRQEEEGTISMILNLENAYVEQKDPNDARDLKALRPIYLGTTTIPVSLEEFQRRHLRIRPSTMTVGQLRTELKRGMLTPELESGFRTEISKRWSFSLACFTFCLIGIPLGVTAQRRETSIGFALSLIVGCVYFLFIIFADTFRENPAAHPHILMWVPNIVFLALGLWLFRRLSRK